MNPIYFRLFDGYAADILQDAGTFDAKSLESFAESLSLTGEARLRLLDTFSSRYLQWSTDAFVLGLHLGLSLWAGPQGLTGPAAPACP